MKGNLPSLRKLIAIYGAPASPRYDELTALEWKRAAAEVDPEQLLAIAFALCTGDGPYEKNLEEGKRLLEKAWNQFNKDPYVLWQQGEIELTGTMGYEADPKDALVRIKSAYEAGEMRAARSLQKAYARGLGVAADPAAAEKWRELADAAGAPPMAN